MWLLLFFVFVPSCLSQTEKIVSCYVRPENPPVEFIDPFLCTHLMMIGSTSLNADGSARMPDEELVRSVVSLKARNEQLKVFLTLLPPNPAMSALVTNKALLRAYVANVTEFLMANDLDGFDVDWEFPVWSGDAKGTDKEGLSDLLRLFRRTFDSAPRRLDLSLAVSSPYTITKKAYDIHALNEFADFVQIMNYDFHFFASNTPFTGLNAPLFPLKYEFLILKKFNSDFSTKFWVSNGLLPRKLVFGIPTYGRGFRLLSDKLHIPYSPAVGVSDRFGDFVTFSQVCEALNSTEYTEEWSEHAKSPYFHGRKQWISHENVQSVSIKGKHAREMDLGGIMLYDLFSDDFEGKCRFGDYPLIRAAKNSFLQQ